MNMQEPVTRAFTGCHVLNPSFEDYTPDAAITVRGEEIVRVGPRSRLEIPDEAAVHDISGCYVIPGLFDFHVHVTEPWVRNERALYLNFGVTGVRDLGSPSTSTLALAGKIAEGTLTGPRIRFRSRFEITQRAMKCAC